MTMHSALYIGSVAHRRLRPRRHRLRYRVFSLLIDLDELPMLDSALRLFSVGQFNLFSFYPRDHLFAGTGDLRGEVDAMLRDAGLTLDGGAIRLLTMPRILGYGFNPLSIFFCHRADGALQAILYEVHNTFGQRHCYLFPVEARGGTLAHACSKRFYVSPFLPMEMAYAFRIRPPEEDCTISITVGDGDGETLVAMQRLARRDLDDRALTRAFLTHPLLTLKVIAGIHYEALLIWLKGVRLHVRPPPPDRAVTVVAAEKSEKEGVQCQI
jgi:uncharacterized protein